MVELLRTTNPAELAWIEALMSGAGIAVFVLDTHMSILEGSIGALPRRVIRIMATLVNLPGAVAIENPTLKS